MKLFISSRVEKTLDITYLDALYDKNIDVYTDYETLMNNYDAFEKMIIKNNCTRCGGKAVINVDADGNMVEETCPLCNGNLSYNVTLITTEEHIFEDLIADHVIIKMVSDEKTLDQTIIDECDYIVIICADKDRQLVHKEYSIKTQDLGLILSYNSKKKGND